MGFSRRPLTVAGQRRNYTYFAAARHCDLIPRMWGELALFETSEDATLFDFGNLSWTGTTLIHRDAFESLLDVFAASLPGWLVAVLTCNALAHS